MGHHAPVVWITRTGEGAEKTARAVRAKGSEAIIAPVLTAHILSPAIDPHLYDALILTSRNGLKGFCALSPQRDLPVWCVGGATAEAARAAGFSHVYAADGDVATLVDLIRTQADPAQRMLYAAPTQPAQNLTQALTAAGFSICEVAVYETLNTPPALTDQDLKRITHILIHSARAAQPIADALKAHHDKIAFNNLTFICISEAAGEALDHALQKAFATDGANYPLTRTNRRISSFPDDASMLMLLDD